jgi:hypothetical protein
LLTRRARSAILLGCPTGDDHPQLVNVIGKAEQMRAWHRKSQHRLDHHTQDSMRFIIGDRGEIYFPGNFLPQPSRPSQRASPSIPPLATTIRGATAKSVQSAAASGEMNDLLLPDGDPVFVWHDLVTTFEYSLSPIPGLTLAMGPHGISVLRFENAVIIDWTTDKDYSPTHPNEELCDFYWDGQQHFLLQFLSFNIIVRAAHLEISLDLE